MTGAIPIRNKSTQRLKSFLRDEQPIDTRVTYGSRVCRRLRFLLKFDDLISRGIKLYKGGYECIPSFRLIDFCPISICTTLPVTDSG